MKRKTIKSKVFQKKFSLKYYLPAFILILAGIFYLTPVKSIVSQKLVAKGNQYFNSGGVYDLKKAAKWYRAAELIDNKSSAARYQLARVYFVQNKLQEAKSEIDKAIAVNSDSNRAYYVRGLINGYSKNYSEAIADFNKFVEKSPGEWAGYNDLAWVYYENKDYGNAKKTLERGLEVKPDNPWLLNGLGAAYHALGENDKANEILDKASQLAGKLTTSEWKLAYPGNDPASADWDLAEFKTNIKFNQGLTYNQSSKEAIVIPACSASCQQACLSGCDLFKMCQDPDHGWNYHGDADPYSTTWVDVGYSDICCPPPPPAWCGDGSCNGGENCLSCPGDCGGCPGSCAWPSGSSFCFSAFPGPACGYSTGPVNLGGEWQWDCPSPNGGPPAIGCASSRIPDIQGQCGASDGGTYCATAQITTPCSTPWGASAITYNSTDKKWYWTCNGQCAGGSSPQCSASMGPIFDAVVGSADGTTFCNGWPADAQLCDTYRAIVKNPDPTSPYGTYSWTCKGGLCGGSDATGSAQGKGNCGWIETTP
jgi:tetratricopeptide (TPR) repeat protein